MTPEDMADIADRLTDGLEEDDIIELLISVNRVGAALVDISANLLDAVSPIPDIRKH